MVEQNHHLDRPAPSFRSRSPPDRDVAYSPRHPEAGYSMDNPGYAPWHPDPRDAEPFYDDRRDHLPLYDVLRVHDTREEEYGRGRGSSFPNGLLGKELVQEDVGS